MSGEPNDKRARPVPAQPETQFQRWAKYGSNVALMIVLAIVVAGLITYIAQARSLRLDTTAQGVNSLKPQTLNVLHGLSTDVRLVSLYAKAEQAPPASAGGAAGARPVDRAGMVADLLDEYRRASGHISVQIIDPNDKAKVDALQSDLDERYGGKGIGEYKRFLEQYDAAYAKLLEPIAGEIAKIGAISANGNDDVAAQIQDGLNGMRRWIENNRADVKRLLQEHRPDYRGITGAVRSTLQKISDREKGFIDFFTKNKDNAKISPQARAYMTESLPRQQQIQKLADDQIARIDKLGELKVDELQQAMNVPNPILVLGPSDWRVLSENQVWPENATVRATTDTKVQPTFAGEQQVTTAILALTTAKKPRVAFLRPGGGPLTTPGFPPFQAGGPLSDFADRLRNYNFDVVEKDMSGQWAMQAQMRGQMAQPEPSWEEIQDAVWVVIDPGTPVQGPDPVAMRFLEHLGHGGSAVVLSMPASGNEMPAGTDPFQSPLRDWGIDLHPDLMAVHEQPPAPPNPDTDPYQDFLRRSYVWDLKEYGDAELARPVRNLESMMILVSPVTTHAASGYTVQNLLPLPDAPAAPRSWGERSYQDVLNGGAARFDKDHDLPGPLFAGATSEKKNGGRVVALGCIYFATNGLLEEVDQSILHNEGRVVARFPGNGELAMNSVFWCARMDSMIALSPSALQVSRIANMSQGTLNFWRVGVLLILLPLAVVVSGVGVFFARRD